MNIFKKNSELLKINEKDLIIDKLFNDRYSIDIQGLYIHPKIVNFLLFQITLISIDHLEYLIFIEEVINYLNNSIIKSKSNRSNKIKYEKSPIDDFIAKYLNRFENGITLNELKRLYSKNTGYYDSRKFKIFKSELKEKMINNGEYRPRQFDGSRPRVYKLKEEFIDLYKNEISDDDLEEI